MTEKWGRTGEGGSSERRAGDEAGSEDAAEVGINVEVIC